MLENAGVILGETYPHRIVTDLKREREISDGNVISIRSKNQQFNDARGYDLVRVCGEMTVVFTKKQFRIDKKGNLLKQESSPKGRSRSKKRGNRAKIYVICVESTRKMILHEKVLGSIISLLYVEMRYSSPVNFSY